MASVDEFMSLDGYESDEGMRYVRDWAADQRLAMQDEIDALEERNAALEERIEALADENEEMADRLADEDDKEATVEEREIVVEARQRALVRKLARFSFDTEQLVAENCALIRDNEALRGKIRDKSSGGLQPTLEHPDGTIKVRLLVWRPDKDVQHAAFLSYNHAAATDSGGLVNLLAGVVQAFGFVQGPVAIMVVVTTHEGGWVEMDERALAQWYRDEGGNSGRKIVSFAYPQHVHVLAREAIEQWLSESHE